MGTIKFPENVDFILNKIKEHGSIGYIVGGCVRDIFLGRTPHDWDICTALLPEEIKEVFNDFQVIETGIKHGTVTVVIDNESYEITTFRIDGLYSDGRHPDNVEFTDKLVEDLKRRDFTINAMAYNPDEGLHCLCDDIFNTGFKDIQKGVIRCVGNPSDRFHEDGLRILRALRFAITLNFEIVGETKRAMREERDLLQLVSKERICEEICKMMTTQFPSAFNVLNELFEILYYCISARLIVNINERQKIIDSLMATNKDDDLVVRIALLLQFTENPKEILSNLRMDNKRSKLIVDILRHKDDYKHIDQQPNEREYAVRKYINEIGFDNFKNLCRFWYARATASSPIYKFKFLWLINQLEIDAEFIKQNHECCTLKQLNITGEDLIDIGYTRGKDIGEVLNKLLDEVMHDPYKNKHNWLVSWAKEMKYNQEIYQDNI